MSPRHSTMPRARGRAFGLTLACALALPFGVVAAPAAFAADAPQPTAHYDMSVAGGALVDVSGNGRDAALSGIDETSVIAAGDDAVLRMRGDGYATLPSGAITGDDNEFTVEMTVSGTAAQNQFGWVIGDGVGPWNTTRLGNHVFVNPVSSQGGYNGEALAGIRVKTGDGNGETRLPAGGGPAAGFSTLTLVGSGDTLTLYRDGEQISTVQHGASLAQIIPSGDVLGYLGRSLYEGDALLRSDVTDLKLWDAALTPDEVVAAQPTAAEKTASSEALMRHDLATLVLGQNPSLDRVTTDLTLPAQVNGVPLTWSTSHPDIVSNTGAVERLAILTDTVVTLTATPESAAPVALDATVLAPRVTSDLDAIALQPRTGEHLPLATVGAVEGATITWESSDPALVTPTDPDYAAPAVGSADPYAGGGIVTRPAYGAGDREVVLTATAVLGAQTDTRSYTVTIAELGRTAPDAGYASAYFKSDSDERIYAAATTGNDFFTFTEVNDGQPVVDNSADTTGHRDPYILRSHDGDKYYMIATDLCIGCGTGWGPAQSEGSLKMNVWESTDLVTWTRTNGDENGGIVVNQPKAGMTWAPEANWDDELQSYVVFFASRLYDDEAHTGGQLHARMFTVLTRDFVTFTEPEEWQNTGYARIDSTVQKIGDTYYRFTKNEDGGGADGLERGKDIFLEKSQVLTAPTTASDWNGDPASTWQLTDTAMTTPITGHAGEGPEIIRLNAGDPSNPSGDGYVFLVDNYSAGGYRAFVTTGDAIASSTETDRVSQRADWVAHDGGLPKSPRHGAFVSVTQQVLDAMHGWRAVEAVASTATSAVDGRTVTTTVTADDGGDVAGTVTFTAAGAGAALAADGAWSETVALTGGAASVEAPAGITEVVASYDGYRDGLVAPSTADAVQLDGDGGTAGAGAGGAGSGGAGGAAGAAGAHADAGAAGGGADTGATGAAGASDASGTAGTAGTAAGHEPGLASTGSGALGALLGLGGLLVAAGAVLAARTRRRRRA
ncbi:immunoglobulin-like domain-containing protein [Leucobacter sp. GX0328]